MTIANNYQTAWKALLAESERLARDSWNPSRQVAEPIQDIFAEVRGRLK